jgi:hypothetical protein
VVGDAVREELNNRGCVALEERLQLLKGVIGEIKEGSFLPAINDRVSALSIG